MPDPLVTKNIEPVGTNLYDIGTSSLYYQNIYALSLEIGDDPSDHQASIYGSGSTTDPYLEIRSAAPTPAAAGNVSNIELSAIATGGKVSETSSIYLISGDDNAVELPTIYLYAGSDHVEFIEGSGFLIETPLRLKEQSADPTAPSEGHMVMWQSDGTGTGSDGDVLVQVRAAGSTRTFTLVSHGAGAGNNVFEEYLYHSGDLDTFIRFEDDKISLAAGGVTFLELTEAAQDIIHFNSADADVDFQVDTTAGAGALFVQGSSGYVAAGHTAPGMLLHALHATDDLLAHFQSSDDLAGIQIEDDDTTGYVVVQNNFLSMGGNSTLHANNLNIATDTGFTGAGTISPQGILELVHGGIRIGVYNNRIERWDSDTDDAQLWLNYQGYNLGTSRFRDTVIGNGKQAAVLTVDGSASRVGVGEGAPTGKGHITQSAAAGAIPVLHLEQDDVSEEFIRYTGTAAAGVLTQSIVDEGDQASETREGWLKVYVVDEGNQITDQAYFVPIYSLSA
jgi:hypothetical protein